jgi:hypothetical protein
MNLKNLRISDKLHRGNLYGLRTVKAFSIASLLISIAQLGACTLILAFALAVYEFDWMAGSWHLACAHAVTGFLHLVCGIVCFVITREIVQHTIHEEYYLAWRKSYAWTLFILSVLAFGKSLVFYGLDLQVSKVLIAGNSVKEVELGGLVYEAVKSDFMGNIGTHCGSKNQELNCGSFNSTINLWKEKTSPTTASKCISIEAANDSQWCTHWYGYMQSWGLHSRVLNKLDWSCFFICAAQALYFLGMKKKLKERQEEKITAKNRLQVGAGNI